MYDDIDYGGPVDFDDLVLPDPEGEDDEDVSEDPTVVAATDELLAAVTAKVHTQHSVGEVELEADVEGPEPTLAHQPPAPQPEPAPPPALPPAQTAAPQPASSAVGYAMIGLILLAVVGAVIYLSTVAS